MKSDFYSKLLQFFTSLRLTVSLLILLATLSIAGTVIQQNAPVNQYLRVYRLTTYRILNALDLFDMYHSWWFITLLVLLSINLITCFLKRFPRTWRSFSRQKKVLDEDLLGGLQFKESLELSEAPEAVKERLSGLIRKNFKNPAVTQIDTSYHLSSEKGRSSRLGSSIIHLSILIILGGGLVGSRLGFEGWVRIVEGESVDRIYLNRGGQKELGFGLRCDDFEVSFYRSGQPREYRSEITVIEGGRDILHQSLRVNHPLSYKGISFYQSDYGTAGGQKLTIGFREKAGDEEKIIEASFGETIKLPDSPIKIHPIRYVLDFQGKGPAVQIVVFEPGLSDTHHIGRPPHKILWATGEYPNPEGLGLRIKDISIKQFTGLMVTRDPGRWGVWVGCGLLMLGLVMALFMAHQRIWVRVEGKGEGSLVTVAGSVNRNKEAFTHKFNRFLEEIRS
jgi:cytochrome c biogenesis protein